MFYRKIPIKVYNSHQSSRIDSVLVIMVYYSEVKIQLEQLD